MYQYAAKDLFQTQSDLVDAKVNIAVNDNISIVIAKIDSLKNDMHEMKDELKADIHDLRQEMNERFVQVDNRFAQVDNRFNQVENRLTAVETKLGMRNEVQNEIRNRVLEYSFKAGWLILATVVSVMFFHVHLL
jgi:phosphoglycerate-specific signal transduction histidine kinase